MSDVKPYEKLTVKELQTQLIAKGLSASGRKQDLVNRLKAAAPAIVAPEEAAIEPAVNAQANGQIADPSADEIAADAATAEAAEETLATAVEQDAAEADAAAEAEADAEADAEAVEEEHGQREPEHIALEDDQHFPDDGEEIPESIKQEQEPAAEDVLQEEVGQPQEESIEKVEDAEDGVKEEEQPAAPDLKQEEPAADDKNLPEWALAPVPVLNVPKGGSLSERDVASLLEASGLSVRSVHFDSHLEANDRRTALVRLEPPELPWLAKAESEESDRDDIGKLALAAVEKLQDMGTPMELGGQPLGFEAAMLNVELFIGNLTDAWEDDAAFHQAMKEYGTVERFALIRNPEGVSKGYAFVEFARPLEAQRCKQAMEKIEQEMRPDNMANRRKSAGEQNDADSKAAPGASAGPGGQFRWEQVKLLRAEWSRTKSVACLFSRILYISNLKPGFKDIALLRSLFEELGEVVECHLPRNKQTGNSKGFAFVEFKTSAEADLAFRELDGIEHEVLGRLLVSFANPAKHYDSSQGGPSTRQGGTGQLGNRMSGSTGSFDSGRGRFNAMNAGPPPGRGPGMQGRGPAFGGRFEAGRGAPPGRFPGGNRQGSGGGAGFNAMSNQMDQQVAMRVQAMQAQQQQAQFQLQAQRMQAQLQAQMRQQQMAMQRQLQQAQQQAQQAQQQAQAAQQAVQAANKKAQQEAEMRRREEEQRKAAERAAAQRAQPRGYGSYGAEASQGDYAGYGNYGNQGGNYSNAGSSQAMGSQGFGSSMGGNQGYGSNAGGGYGGEGTGDMSSGYGGNASGNYGSQGAYGNQGGTGGTAGGYSQGGAAGGYGAYASQGNQNAGGSGSSAAGYGSQSNYGSSNQGSYGTSGYGNQGYGNYSNNAGGNANAASTQGGYGQGSYNNTAGYGANTTSNYTSGGQGGYGGGAGSKRDSSDYAGYNQSSYGGHGSYGQQDNKRSRY